MKKSRYSEGLPPYATSSLASRSKTLMSSGTIRTVRNQWLGMNIFHSIQEVQDCATKWMWTYNNDRPNMGIGGITPAMKLNQYKMAA